MLLGIKQHSRVSLRQQYADNFCRHTFDLCFAQGRKPQTSLNTITIASINQVVNSIVRQLVLFTPPLAAQLPSLHP